ncbi:MAG TPA: glutamate-5-semialdehyde dehydrogenase [bacterium]|mgnify:FL=1|nr:glutamate-5-semialdehyde dehydrogenase [bacterium]HPO82346.1 glutamate-5-semialdehyde dehydrogenase [bacterium]HRR91351.1 glutamate-5-semialdehyde dehydrogenase [bacterium]
MDVKELAKKTKSVSYILANAKASVKNSALLLMADRLEENVNEILSANRLDLDNAKNLSSALTDRLTLNEKRISAMATSLREVARLEDPIGKTVSAWRRPNGLEIQKVRVPIGVIGIIYEARPNVTADAAGLCIKAGNGVILKGGSEAINSNRKIVEVLQSAAVDAGLPPEVISFVDDTRREATLELMHCDEYVDLLIPRGGANLIQTVRRESTVPVIETGVGNCHVYVDDSADLSMAEEITFNAKVQRPGVCNAIETLLVNEKVSREFLPEMLERLRSAEVEVRGCQKTREIVPWVLPATEEDWYTEYLDLIIAVKVVEDVDSAIAHINKYGSHHSESIVTRDYFNARKFLNEVDAACVYVNASTRFTDGFEFGLGAEIGISTQKLHARGPMGLEEITTTKYIIYGEGQIRG